MSYCCFMNQDKQGHAKLTTFSSISRRWRVVKEMNNMLCGSVQCIFMWRLQISLLCHDWRELHAHIAELFCWLRNTICPLLYILMGIWWTCFMVLLSSDPFNSKDVKLSISEAQRTDRLGAVWHQTFGGERFLVCERMVSHLK